MIQHYSIHPFKTAPKFLGTNDLELMGDMIGSSPTVNHGLCRFLLLLIFRRLRDTCYRPPSNGTLNPTYSSAAGVKRAPISSKPVAANSGQTGTGIPYPITAQGQIRTSGIKFCCAGILTVACQFCLPHPECVYLRVHNGPRIDAPFPQVHFVRDQNPREGRICIR